MIRVISLFTRKIEVVYGKKILKSTKKLLLFFLSSVIIIYGILCVLLFVFQKRMLYHQTPERISIGDQRYFKINDVNLKISTINKGRETAIIYFGGNAEQVENNSQDFQKFSDVTTYFFNYRGYGGSSGKPDQNDIFRDALSFYDIIKTDHKKIIAVGRSLGSGVATFLSSKRDIAKLILITPYDSIENVAAEIFPCFPVKIILTQKFESYRYAKKVQSKAFIIYAENDVLISTNRTLNLARSFYKPMIVVVREADHNTISLYPLYWKSIKMALSD